MICGIDIKSNEAIIVLCENSEEKLVFTENKFKKIALDATDQDHYKSFYETFCDFIKLHEIEKIYLKKPVDKGRQIAGANAFRIEALLNLCAIPVVSIHAVTITTYLKKNPLNVDNCKRALQYQMGALSAAYYGFSKRG